MRKYILTAISLSCVVSAATAANWELVDNRDNEKRYVDTTRIVKSPFGHKARVWIEYGDPQAWVKSPIKYFRSIVILSYYDCQNKTHAAAQVAVYAGARRSGDIVYSESKKPTKDDFLDVAPGSTGEAIFDFVCSFKTPSQ